MSTPATPTDPAANIPSAEGQARIQVLEEYVASHPAPKEPETSIDRTKDGAASQVVDLKGTAVIQVRDFAGGTVVHLSSASLAMLSVLGIAVLLLAIHYGRRQGS